MKRAESKKKNRPSLDLTGTEPADGQHGSSMYSVASGVEDEESGEEGGDQASPLRSEMDTGVPLRSERDMDISGGIGTPVYVVSMDNLFEQDAILGKKPRQPSCLAKLLCGVKAAPSAATQPVEGE